MPLAIFAGIIFIITLYYNNFAAGGSIYSKVILPLVTGAALELEGLVQSTDPSHLEATFLSGHLPWVECTQRGFLQKLGYQ